MRRELLLNPRFVGKRFEKHSIPLDLLKDIANLEPFIIEIAKWKYLQDHQDRQRVPKGFTDKVSLKLTAIKDGSALPLLELEYTQDSMIKPESVKYFLNARDVLIDVIDAAEKGKEITEYMPPFLLSYFDKIGRSLEKDENIEFNPYDTVKPARLNKHTRRTLIQASSSANDFTEERILRGSIPEADQEKMTFELQIIGGPRVKAPIEPQYLGEVLEAFSGYKKGLKVKIQGIVRLNRFEKIEKIESIDLITLLDPLDIGARLDELRQFKRGWFDDKGEALDHDALAWFEEMMTLYYPDELPNPYIYQSPEGNLLLEWENDRYDISLELDLSSKKGWLHILDLDTQEDQENRFHLSDPEDWKVCIEMLEKSLAEVNDA